MEFENVPMPAGTVPAEICEKCAAVAVFHRPMATAAVHCEHTLIGAIYPLDGTWHLVRDIGAAQFRDLLVKTLTRAELLGDVRRAISLIEQSDHATKH